MIEIPALDELYTSFEMIHRDEHIDGMALAGSTFLEEYWEDVLDHAECPWILFRDLLSHDIASKLADITPHIQEKIILHALKTLKRTGSFDLEYVSLNLGFDHLAWPHKNKTEIIAKGLEGRKAIIEAILPTLELTDTILCLPLRLPVPSIAKDTTDILTDFIKDIGHPQVGMMLHIVIDELKTESPEQIAELINQSNVIAFQYIPKLGIKMTDSMHKNWSEYIKSKSFDGAVCFIPVEVNNQDLFNYDLNRLSKHLKAEWF